MKQHYEQWVTITPKIVKELNPDKDYAVIKNDERKTFLTGVEAVKECDCDKDNLCKMCLDNISPSTNKKQFN